jgi:hypothetical protein
VIIVAVEPHEGSYGFRFFLPAILVVLPFSVMAANKILRPGFSLIL